MSTTQPPEPAIVNADAVEHDPEVAARVKRGELIPVDPSQLAQPPATYVAPSLAGMNVRDLGEVFAASGMFKDATDPSRGPAQAMVKIIYGAEMGLSPLAAMTGIYMVDGKLSVGGQLLAAILKQPRWAKKYRLDIIQFDRMIAEVALHERDPESGEWNELEPHSVFTIDDAIEAGLVEGINADGSIKAKKDNWRKYPRNMLLWRAVTNLIRLHAQEVTGGAPVYSPDELDAQVDTDGRVSTPQTPTGRASIPAKAAAHGQASTPSRPIEGTATSTPRASAKRKPTEAKPINAAQKRRLWAEAERVGLKGDEKSMRALMLWISGEEHSDRIPADKFDLLLAAFADAPYALDQLVNKAQAGQQRELAIYNRYLAEPDPAPAAAAPEPEPEADEDEEPPPGVGLPENEDDAAAELAARADDDELAQETFQPRDDTPAS